MGTEATLGPEQVDHVGVEPPLYRSRYGGLWTDRRDAHAVLENRLVRGEVTDADAELLAHYIDHGYVILEQATDESVIDEYLDFFETAWNDPPDRCWLQWSGEPMPMDRKFYDKVTKVGSLHLWFDRAGELIFPQRVLRFLTQIYDRPPVAFQTLTLRKGSQENLHIDTGPLTLTEPMSLVGSWVALEDVQPLSGEFQFIPGSHQTPELLHHGTGKGHQSDYDDYYKVLQGTHRMCEERGLETKTFIAKKGDVLIWHGDLMHGGAPIQDQSRTRKSLIAHLMPLGVMPTFFDFSEAGVFPYAGGGYSIDVPWRDMLSIPDTNDMSTAARGGKDRLVDLWRGWIPIEVRKRIPPSFAAWARQHAPK
jgi:phytanoyl-CoA hydroxylase